MRRTYWHRVIFIATGLVASSFAAAQFSPNGYLIIESYYWTKPTVKGASNRATWVKGEFKLNPNLKFVGTYSDVPIYEATKRYLGEGFAEYRTGDKIIRAGRFPLKFGFGEWSDLAYTPINRWPMIRTNAVNSLNLLRYDTGFDIEGGSANLQYQLGVVDVRSKD